MSNDSKFGRVYLNREQLEYVLKMIGTNDPKEAVEQFAIILLEEKADPNKMTQYIDKLILRGLPR